MQLTPPPPATLEAFEPTTLKFEQPANINPDNITLALLQLAKQSQAIQLRLSELLTLQSQDLSIKEGQVPPPSAFSIFLQTLNSDKHIYSLAQENSTKRGWKDIKSNRKLSIKEDKLTSIWEVELAITGTDPEALSELLQTDIALATNSTIQNLVAYHITRLEKILRQAKITGIEEEILHIKNEVNKLQNTPNELVFSSGVINESKTLAKQKKELILIAGLIVGIFLGLLIAIGRYSYKSHLEKNNQPTLAEQN